MVLEVFVSICLPILVMAAVGWVLDRSFGLDLRTLVKLTINVILPAFMFSRVVASNLSGEMVLKTVLFTAAMIALLFALAELLGRAFGRPKPMRRSWQMAAMFYNSGNYGIPLIALAYPVVGPPIQVFVLLAQNVANFSLGMLLASSGGGRQGWRAWLPALRQAPLWGVAAAFLVRFLEIPVTEWKWVWQPVNYLGDALVGVALVTLGTQLSQTASARPPRDLAVAVPLRLVGGPALALPLVWLFGFEGDVAAALVLGAGVPTAVNVALIAHDLDADHAFLAACVFYTTLCSVVTVSIVATLLRLFPVFG